MASYVNWVFLIEKPLEKDVSWIEERRRWMVWGRTSVLHALRKEFGRGAY